MVKVDSQGYFITILFVKKNGTAFRKAFVGISHWQKAKAYIEMFHVEQSGV